MIQPHKYLDFNNSILVTGARIIAILKQSPKIKYDKLTNELIKGGDDNVRIVFPEALSFLFLLGKVNYIQTTDEVILTNENTANIF